MTYPSNSDSVADEELKSFVRRIENVEEQIASYNSDKSEIYKEARAKGYDTKQIRKVVAKRKLPADERSEQDTVFELYWDVVHGRQTSLVRAHVENIEEFGSDKAEIEPQPSKAAGQTVAAVSPVVASPVESEAVEISTPTPEPQQPLPAVEEGDALAALVFSPPIQPETANEKPETSDASSADRTRSVSSARKDDEAEVSGASGEAQETAAAVGASPASRAAEDIAAQPVGGENVAGHRGLEAVGIEKSDFVDDVQTTATGKSVAASAAAAPAILEKPTYPPKGVITWESTPAVGVIRHEYSQAFGEAGQDIAVIEDDMANAQSAPIVKIGNVIIDGWARYMKARDLGIEYPVVQYDGSDSLIDVIRWNVQGRMMTSEQMFRIAQRLAKAEPKRKADIYAAFELGMELVQ